MDNITTAVAVDETRQSNLKYFAFNAKFFLMYCSWNTFLLYVATHTYIVC